MTAPAAAAAPVATRSVAARRELPLVSVIVPVFNGEHFLAESLDSILGQTYPRLEVIVVDDASLDSTPEILAAYGDRIRTIRQRSTRGIYGNANDGIAEAAGDLIAVFHADDVYEPTLLEREVDWLQRHPDAGAVFCSDVFIDGAGREIGRLELPPEVRGEQPLDYGTVLNALLTHTNVFLRCPTALVRADVYRAVGVYRDDEFKNSSDIEMWLRIVRRYPIGILEEHLLRYRRGHGSSSERFHHVRTQPFRFFRILDLELGAGGRRVATPGALRAFEGHRAVDMTLCAVSHYILDAHTEAAMLLARIRISTFLATRRVQRWRMSALVLLLRTLVRLPHVGAIARRFERHWYRSETSRGPA
jgi:glycosyltransferase involved in cell wall biosynthesis